MAVDFEIIGKRLKQARKDVKLTQENLAEKMDVSVAYLSKVETGKIHINLERLAEICGLLGVTEGQILNGVSSNSQDYLDIEFYKLLKSCSIENQKLVYDITKLIANKEI